MNKALFNLILFIIIVTTLYGVISSHYGSINYKNWGKANNSQQNAAEGWRRDSLNQAEYEVTYSRQSHHVHSGQQSVSIKSKDIKDSEEFRYIQSFSAEQFIGKRMELTAYVKLAELSNKIALFASQSETSGRVQAYVSELHSDTAKNTWHKLRVVSDVIDDTTMITIGFHMIGHGSVWLDSITWQEVDKFEKTVGKPTIYRTKEAYQNYLDSVGATATATSEKTDNLGFEQPILNANTGWQVAPVVMQDYDIIFDNDVTYSGDASLSFTTKEHVHPQSIGVVYQKLLADNYLGKKVQLSAFIKRENTTNKATLWFRVNNSENKTIAFENLQHTRISLSNPWQKETIVLDIAKDASTLSFGLLTTGSGQIWLDDVELTILESLPNDYKYDNAIETLFKLPTTASNLSFEQNK